jgi:prophage DNA circulation protein
MSRHPVSSIKSGADSVKRQLKKGKIVSRCKSDVCVGPRVDFLSAAATEDKGYFRLSFGEFEAMSERLDDLQDTHVEMIQALQRFAATVSVFVSGGMPTAREIDALNRLAMAHAARASEARNLLAELRGALVDRELYDLLEALRAPNMNSRNRKSKTTNQYDK